MYTKRISLPFALLVSLPVWGIDESLELDPPVVISASRLNQSILHSPSAITVIDKNIIAPTAYTDIADVFRLVLGFQVSRADGRTYSVNSLGVVGNLIIACK